MKLGPIAEWGLNMSKTIEVNAKNFETTKKAYLLLEIFVAIQEN